MSDQRLADELRSRAAGIGHEHPLDLDDVKQRARGIRRRRRAVTGLAAAAVLSVALPVGLSLDRPSTTPPNPLPAASQTPGQDEGQDEPDRRGVLTNDVDATSGAPAIPYLLDGEVVTTDGERIPLEGDPRSFAPLGDGWVTGDFAAGAVRFFDAEGSEVRTEEATGALAASRDGTVVAWATPDGRLLTESTEGGTSEMPAPPEGSPVQPVAVTGSGSCEPEGEGCVVFSESTGETQAAYASSSTGGTTRITGLLGLGGASVDGRVSGVVSVSDDGSCSAVAWPYGEPEWQTCDHTLDRFSPDGRHVIGLPAYLDGLGNGSLAILDVNSQDVVAEWSASEETQAYVNTAVWDADGTVLATVYEKGSWALMRMSPDGGLTTVLELEGGDESAPPLVLPVAP